MPSAASPPSERRFEADYDVLVVGGGHAGTEAAVAAARLGARVALVTSALEALGQMSCNPAIGGVAKGTVVREVDALGGIMGRATDLATLQFRMLNRGKGPAVWAPRAQCDRGLYRRAVRSLLEEHPLLHTVQGTVARLLIDEAGWRVVGVETLEGRRFGARAVVITTGTFLRGMIHIGETRIPAGRVGEAPSIGLAETLHRLGLSLARLKTGTPPRLDGRTIDWAALQPDPGDDPPEPLSWMTDRITNRQVACAITATTPASHDLIRANLHRTAVYGGRVEGVGPRYFPPIEDKGGRFAERGRHQIFL